MRIARPALGPIPLSLHDALPISRLQVHVHRMRRLLEDEDALVREGAGYRLLLVPGDLDAEVFDRLADRALDRQNSPEEVAAAADRKSTRLNSSHVASSYAVFCLK